jgi:hypothetical protein
MVLVFEDFVSIQVWDTAKRPFKVSLMTGDLKNKLMKILHGEDLTPTLLTRSC